MKYEFVSQPACNMCGSDRRRLIGMRLSASQGLNPRSAEGIAVPVKRCLNCGLIYADPLPIPESLDDHYGLPPEDYWTAEAFRWDESYFAEEIVEARRLIGEAERPTALDIGVGLGKAMTSLRKAGFEVRGIEPSAVFRAKAIEWMKLDPDDVVHSDVEHAEFEPEAFDFITFGAVLEHLYDPSAALDKAMRWLKPGGIIQAEVPSSSHLIPRLINAYFRLRGTNYVTHISPMHSPFHLYEFGLESFARNGERLGYAIASHRYMVCEIMHGPTWLHPPLRWLMDRTDTGMQLQIYLRKPG